MQTANPTDTLTIMSQEVAKITNRESVPVDVALSELGVDSLNIIELMLFSEQLYGAFDPGALSINEYTTLTDLDEQLRNSAQPA